MTNKYEQLIEYIVNEEADKARDLFHEIVVEKSREIYENIIDEDDLVGEDEVEETVGGDEADDLIDDIEADEEGLNMEDVDLDLDEADEDEMNMDAEEGEMDMDADAEFDYDNDGDMDDHEEDHEELEDRVVDLESALDELKAEFDQLMADEDGEGEDEAEENEEETEESLVREYTEKAPEPKKSEEGANTDSPVAGKNDMGGDASNIAQGGDEKGAKPKMPNSMDGTTEPDMKAAPKAVTKDGADNTESTIGS